MRDKTAWLIEKNGLCLGVCGQRFAWVTFTDENAVRFSRRRDAKATMDALTFESRLGKEFRDVVITEYMWESYASQAEAPSPRFDAYALEGCQCPKSEGEYFCVHCGKSVMVKAPTPTQACPVCGRIGVDLSIHRHDEEIGAAEAPKPDLTMKQALEQIRNNCLCSSHIQGTSETCPGCIAFRALSAAPSVETLAPAQQEHYEHNRTMDSHANDTGAAASGLYAGEAKADGEGRREFTKSVVAEAPALTLCLCNCMGCMTGWHCCANQCSRTELRQLAKEIVTEDCGFHDDPVMYMPGVIGKIAKRILRYITTKER